MTKQTEYAATKPMRNPAHPGEVLSEMITDGLGLKIGEAAEKLDVDRTTLSRLLNGHISISVEMSLRLAKAIDTTPRFWLTMQQNYDLSPSRIDGVDLSRVMPFAGDGNQASL